MLGAVGQIFFKKGMSVIGAFYIKDIIKILFNPWIFSGFVFYGSSSIIWLYSLSKFQLSSIYPLLSLGYIITCFAGVYLFNESITKTNILGIALICIGVILITFKGRI